jgi:hypothetical protein
MRVGFRRNKPHRGDSTGRIFESCKKLWEQSSRLIQEAHCLSKHAFPSQLITNLRQLQSGTKNPRNCAAWSLLPGSIRALACGVRRPRRTLCTGSAVAFSFVCENRLLRWQNAGLKTVLKQDKMSKSKTPCIDVTFFRQTIYFLAQVCLERKIAP